MEPTEKKRKRSFTTRHAESRATLARQPWPEFLKDLAIRSAAILAVVLAVAVVVWSIAR